MDFPSQVSVSTSRKSPTMIPTAGFDMRDALNPRRLTIVMWDQAFVLRHGLRGAFEDFDRVLDETSERGYNTLRLDPMPQWLDLTHPEKELHWPDPKQPYLPWDWNTEVTGPVGLWLIEFMEKALERRFHYTLSAWWTCDPSRGPRPIRTPRTHEEAAEMWAVTLTDWRRLFGFNGLVYVDVANEIPFFLPGYLDLMKKETGAEWWGGSSFSPAQLKFIADDLDKAMSLLQREFPELRFTGSIHGDLRWMDVPVNFDCLDVHFYADADSRWTSRTRFPDYMKDLTTQDYWHADFSDRCMKTARAIAPMLRARQRGKLAQFAAWAEQQGTPLTTSESWASWYYYDSPNLDWSWLLDWAEWSVEDAIEFRMWGWTPHNYCQPQFSNWKDVRWHQRLTSRFLNS